MTDQPTSQPTTRRTSTPAALSPSGAQPPEILDGDTVRRAAGLAPRSPAPEIGAASDDGLLIVAVEEDDAAGAASREVTARAASSAWALGPRPTRWNDNPSTGPVLLAVTYYPRTSTALTSTNGARMLVIAGIARVDSTQWMDCAVNDQDAAGPVDPDLAQRWTIPIVEPLQDPTGGAVNGKWLDLGYEFGWAEPDEQWGTA